LENSRERQPERLPISRRAPLGYLEPLHEICCRAEADRTADCRRRQINAGRMASRERAFKHKDKKSAV
jgi:hypothetical protein